MNIKEGIQRTVEGNDLSKSNASEIMREILTGKATPAQFGSFVTALRVKGETPEEIAGMVQTMREFSLHVETNVPVIDTCGTGGDSKGWFNISTATALVVAGADIPVAKHGNRAMSGSTGSADVLELLGVNISHGPEVIKESIEKIGIGFMFAQVFHPAMKFAGPLRPEIGIRTIFNILGPLTNPAKAKRQVIGTSDQVTAKKIAETLKILGTEYSMVVHSESGADEIDIEGSTLIYQVTNKTSKRRRTRPADFGLPEGSNSDLIAKSTEESAAFIREILDGSGSGHNPTPSPEVSRRNVVIINAAAAILIAEKANSFQDAAFIASNSIDSGSAKLKLNLLINATSS